MTRRFGRRDTFAAEVGEAEPPDMRVVDLWAAGTWLTTDDNVAYVPSLCHYLRMEAARVRARDVPPASSTTCRATHRTSS
jgi:hypothetical protein